DPKTKKYCIVTSHAADYNLRNYLQNNKISWLEKINILDYIINDLAIIHKLEITHCHLNLENVLMSGNLAFLISEVLRRGTQIRSLNI
ncbi:2664_t:CDS:2, partial [Funneliformis mosseae]